MVDSELKNLQAEVLMNNELISTIKLLYNPISGYYFSQFEPDSLGSYVFNNSYLTVLGSQSVCLFILLLLKKALTD